MIELFDFGFWPGRSFITSQATFDSIAYRWPQMWQAEGKVRLCCGFGLLVAFLWSRGHPAGQCRGTDVLNHFGVIFLISFLLFELLRDAAPPTYHKKHRLESAAMPLDMKHEGPEP